MRIDVFHHNGDVAFEQEVLRLLNLIVTKENIIMADTTDLEAKVAANTDVVESAITLLNGLKAALDQAGTDPVKLAALSATLADEDGKLAAAIAANTPAAPPAPAPAPAP